MANYFDKYDSAGGNYFDRYDAPEVPGGTLTDIATGIGQGATFGHSDEITAGMATPFRMGYRAIAGGDEGKEFWQRAVDAYNTELENTRNILHTAKERTPVGSTAGEVVGGLGTGGTLAKGGATLLNVAKPTVPRMAAAGAGEGALYGGAYGFGTGEGAADRAQGAAGGAATGVVLGSALGAGTGWLAKLAGKRAVPSVDSWREAKKIAYMDVDNLGARYTPSAVDRLINGIKTKAAAEKLNPKRQPKAASMIDDLDELSGGMPTLTELDQLRQIVRRDVANNKDGSEAFFGNLIIDEIDDFIRTATNADMVSQQGAKAANDAITKARAANSTWRKAETIEDALVRAERKAARAGSGGNIDNSIRQEIDSILRSPKKSRFFNKEELAAMEKVVRGGKMQNFARWLGKLSPEGNGLSLLLHGLIGIPSGIATGGLSTAAQVPLAVGGFAAKRIADAATPANLNAVSTLIRNQGRPMLPNMTPTNRSIAEFLIKGQAPLSAGLLDSR